MAIFEAASEPRRLTIGSYQTALCIIPPVHLCKNIDRLRAVYDNAYGKWPAHINIIYPFVALESLPQAIKFVRSRLSTCGHEYESRNTPLRLDESNHFSHRHSDTIFIAPSDSGGTQRLKQIRSALLEDFKHENSTYRPHLTIGQNQTQDASLREHLLAKASLLLPIEWCINELVVLVRERTHGEGNMPSRMTIWGTIPLSGETTVKAQRFSEVHGMLETEEDWPDESTDTHRLLQTLRANGDNTGPRHTSTTQPEITYRFSADNGIWKPVPKARSSFPPLEREQIPSTLSISSYNVLVDSIYPPVQDRYALLLSNLLSESALADILVLQEVSDDFLSYLLAQGVIQSYYPFATHGPPNQPAIGPLASLRNIVVLSRWDFSWEWVPFERRHKGAVILALDAVGKFKDSNFLPLIMAGVHFTSGLTDGAVAAKKSQLQALVNHLSSNYAENPWIIAGDFNVTTSAFTIDAALKNKSISPQTASDISSLDMMLSSVRLSDAWFVSRAEIGKISEPNRYLTEFEDLPEGEQGATFDPVKNSLAAEASGKGSNNRPQRYDRILVKDEHFLRVAGFNMFGFPEGSGCETGDGKIEDGNAEPPCGSDHWGIRATLRTDLNSTARVLEDHDIRLARLQLRKAPSNLSHIATLKSCLAELSMFPTDEEIDRRKEAFALVKGLLQQSAVQQDIAGADNKRSIVSMIVVSVGSYGLGVWSNSSDIDCLCIGSITGKTFFALASQRLRRAAALGVRILRKVKATSGLMLELDVRGIKFDLQYCPATRLAERWSEAIRLPPSDPLFDLPMLSLTKLKSFRDLEYLQRTIPDLATFRTAYRFIRAWAQQRGIYSSKFGYLGGIHITLMLSRICKLLFRDAGAITAADIICTFYNHYANFDWKTQMVFDPFFQKHQPQYHRSAREPMVILGPHTPVVNVAHTASYPSLRTLVEELQRADKLLSDPGLIWQNLISSTDDDGPMTDLPSGAREHLASYNSYIKINVQYWGLSLAKGSTLVGWLESRCALLLVDINRKLPDIHARIWPARFKINYARSEDEKDYQGCYLIGLAKAQNTGVRAMTESDRKVAQGTLLNVLERFADQIRSDEKYFDATSSWVDVLHVKRSELVDLKVDDRQWGNHVIQEDESETEDEADEPISGLDNNEETAASSSARPKKLTTGKSTHKTATTKKLRPATDILNRLRWDPNFDSSDYIIGYEDRFLGTREMVLERWKTEQTDEEFIPQHRIMYFKRRGDGVVVWERDTRRDDIFGSGVGKWV